ncbi:MAG: type II toxin-antitoxin system VapC family toxin [Acidobacteria bacterium]|nr:type II toxin-antitoxin system VapC family toxin [Acidobacteriota bacterium]MCI0626699.1 type II toxin-antitoxin system VapC family toxin [Acidobacteriota bacterium]MCI0720590.1 type II toxin-antitoxin system VapC family toxin [Acidobacteriota bacterium]
MGAKVLDSWALLAFFEDEPEAGAVEELLDQAAREKHRLYLSVVNWGEVYYSTMRKVSQAEAEERAQEIATLPIDVVGVGDDFSLVRQAAIFKAAYRLAYADAFAAALAREKKAELVTGDPEFKALAKEIKIAWLK